MAAAGNVVSDFLQYILEQGGQVSSEKLGGFYSKHPPHRAAIKNMKTFCAQHPEVFMICDGQPHWTVIAKLPGDAEVAGRLASHINKLGGSADLADLEVWKERNPALAQVVHKGGRTLKAFFDKHASKFSVESKGGVVVKVSRKKAPTSTPDRAKVAACLALYVHSKGGSMEACDIHQYYKLHAGHKEVIGKLRTFCNEEKGLLVFEMSSGGGTISLPKHCCSFLLKSCSHEAEHKGFLHSSSLPSGAIHCAKGIKCKAGHWDRIAAQASQDGVPCPKPPPPPLPPAVETSSDFATCIAANLAVHVHGQGGSMTGTKISEYYALHSAHKAAIAQPGFGAFCRKYPGLFSFDASQGSGLLSLAKHCCHFLRGECIHSCSHDGKLHSTPTCSAVLCAFGSNCKHDHWKRVEKLAVQSHGPVPAVTSEASVFSAPSTSKQLLAVEDMRWTHDTIRASFRDGRLLVETLVELLQGRLLPSELPAVEVLETKGSFYVIEGNRRLWVLKEFKTIMGEAVKVPVKRRVDLKGFAQSFTTKNGGQSVEFETNSFHTSRKRTYPSMGFALAVFFGRPPNDLEMAVGREVAKALSRTISVESLKALHAEAGALGLEAALERRPELFNVVDGLVGLADSMRAFGALTSRNTPSALLDGRRSSELDAGLDTSARQLLEDRMRGSIQACEGYAPLAELSQALALPQEMLFEVLKQSDAFRVAFLKSSIFVSLADAAELPATRRTSCPDPMSCPDLLDISDTEDPCVPSSGPGCVPSLEAALTEVLQRAGGSMALTELEWTEVCMAHFPNLRDLREFVVSLPKSFSLRPEGAGQVVAIVQGSAEGLPGLVLSGGWDPHGICGDPEAGDLHHAPRELHLIHGRILMFVTVGRVTPALVCKVAALQAEKLPTDKDEELSGKGRLIDPASSIEARSSAQGHEEQRRPLPCENSVLELGLGCENDELAEVKQEAGHERNKSEAGMRPVEPECLMDLDVPFIPEKSECATITALPPGSEAPQVLTSVKPPAEHGRWGPGKRIGKPDPPTTSSTTGLSGLARVITLLPSRLVSLVQPAGSLASLLLHSNAQRIVLRVGGPMKVALARGWLEQARLPEAAVSQQELLELASRLGWKAADAPPLCPVPLLGTLHRVSFGFSATKQICLATIHLGRNLPITSQPARQLLEHGSVAFLGPSSSGKTTALRAAAAALSAQEQVLVVDFRAELLGIDVDPAQLGLQHVGYFVPQLPSDEGEAILRAIDDHVPEVIVAEFMSAEGALSAARRCVQAGVRLICSLRGSLKALPAGCPAAVSEDFPFSSLVELSRQDHGSWRVFREAGAQTATAASTKVSWRWETSGPESFRLAFQEAVCMT